MSSNASLETVAQAGPIDAAAEANLMNRVVRGAGRIELMQKPQASLSRGKGRRGDWLELGCQRDCSNHGQLPRIRSGSAHLWTYNDAASGTPFSCSIVLDIARTVSGPAN